ncbi:MAG: Ig-like domain-containing protein, partial [Gemmatimonadetes bacterium]|nr:Ig-like domain-containing protein [Gemmatimonadota bacterium]
LLPDSLFLWALETGHFNSIPMDQRQNPLMDRAERTEWAVSNSSIATLTSEGSVGTVTGVQAGATNVRVTLGRGSGIGRVYVEPAELAEIRIEPSNIELAAGMNRFEDRIPVRPILIGLDGNEVPATGYRISWRTSNPQIFLMVGRQEVVSSVSISVGGGSPGQATLTLQVGDRKVTTPVIVR